MNKQLIQTFVEQLQTLYPAIEMEVAMKCWESLSPALSMRDMTSLSKTDLKELCKGRGLPVSGTKAQLISRLLGGSTSAPSDESPPVRRKVKKASKKQVAAVIGKIMEDTEHVHIRRNMFGNYEHVGTRLVFDEVTKKVIGKQTDNGKVLTLVPEDIDICKELQFEYVLPPNLASAQQMN